MTQKQTQGYLDKIKGLETKLENVKNSESSQDYLYLSDENEKLKLQIRKDFSKKERIDYARRLERIERVKAEQREKAGGRLNLTEGEKGRANGIVAEKTGIGSRSQYEKEKFIDENADPETLSKWDTSEISTHAAYIKIKKEKEAAEDKIQKLPIRKNFRIGATREKQEIL